MELDKQQMEDNRHKGYMEDYADRSPGFIKEHSKEILIASVFLSAMLSLL